MATFDIDFVSVCGGGEHAVVHISATTPNIERDVTVTRSEFNSPLTVEEVELIVRALLRFKKTDEGLTNAQLVAALQAGVTVTL